MAAIDNYGDAYLSLLQANNNQYTLAEFVRELVQKLEVERPNWREDTILLVDGAKMHTTELVQSIYQKLKVPTMVASPYSYNLMATEKWHALFKSGELNPTGKSMTKSKYAFIVWFTSEFTPVEFFSNVIQVAVEKARSIRRATVIMIWHHITSELYQALDLKKL